LRDEVLPNKLITGRSLLAPVIISLEKYFFVFKLCGHQRGMEYKEFPEKWE